MCTQGWNYTGLLGNKEKVLKIGVPARGAFNQFVRVTSDETQTTTYVTGFSVDVFEAVVKKLPYHLPYTLAPFYGSYDDLVQQVHNKVLLFLCSMNHFLPISAFWLISLTINKLKIIPTKNCIFMTYSNLYTTRLVGLFILFLFVY